LEYELARLGVPASAVVGYRREAQGHLAVAASVAAGRSDCGLGLQAAAQAFGLGFVPVVTEPYELVLEAAFLEDPLLSPLWELLASPRFQASVAGLGGYETSDMGRRVL
jgi:putative molybdopterin biosynthesis protein